MKKSTETVLKNIASYGHITVAYASYQILKATLELILSGILVPLKCENGRGMYIHVAMTSTMQNDDQVNSDFYLHRADTDFTVWIDTVAELAFSHPNPNGNNFEFDTQHLLKQWYDDGNLVVQALVKVIELQRKGQ